MRRRCSLRIPRRADEIHGPAALGDLPLPRREGLLLGQNRLGAGKLGLGDRHRALLGLVGDGDGLFDLRHLLRNQSPWYDMKKRSFSEERRQRYCAQHSEIVDAILRRDPEGARAATFAHLKTVETNILGR
jgi:hypothetical protein